MYYNPSAYSGNVIQYEQKRFLFHCYSNAFIGAASCAATADADDDDDSDGKIKVTLKRISNGKMLLPIALSTNIRMDCVQ